MYGVTAALGIYTHLMMAFVVAGHVVLYLWILASRARSGHRLPRRFFLPAYGFVLCVIVSLLLYAPVLPAILAHTIGAARESVRYEWASPLWWALGELVRGLRSGTAGGLLAIGIGGIMLLCGLLSYWQENHFLVGLVGLPGLMTAAAVLATSHNFWPRFLFFEIGFALLFLVRGAMVLGNYGLRLIGGSQRSGSQAGTVLVLLLLLASVVPLRPPTSIPSRTMWGR